MEPYYSISIADSDAGFSDLNAQWQALASVDDEATPFNTYDWLSLWWKHYRQPDYALHIVLFSENGKLVAIAPLYLLTIARVMLIQQRELRWVGSGGDTSPDYLNIICIPEHRPRVAEHFARYLAQQSVADRINLTDIAKPSILYEHLNTTLSSCKGLLFAGVTNTILNNDLPTTWDEYRMALTRKRRKQINHRRNRLDKAGDWSLNICTSQEQQQHAVTALEELHRQRWISKGETGGFLTDAYIEFHRDVIKRFSEHDQLWLATLVLNGKTIGVLYIFLWRGTLFFFQSGFSPEHDSLSPGHVLFTYVISEAIKRGIGHIDLLKGNYIYKTVYAKQKQVTSGLIFERPGIGCMLSRSKQLIKSWRR